MEATKAAFNFKIVMVIDVAEEEADRSAIRRRASPALSQLAATRGLMATSLLKGTTAFERT